MSELDKKLESWLHIFAQSYAMEKTSVRQTQEVINARNYVKQAFLDDGWINWRSLPEGIYVHTAISFSQVAAGNFMTGQEWLARFQEEHIPYTGFISKEYNDGYADARIKAMEAAKKASNIK